MQSLFEKIKTREINIKEDLILLSWHETFTLNKTCLKSICTQKESTLQVKKKDISKYNSEFFSQLKRMNNGLPMAEEPVINRNAAYQVVNGVLASLKN